MTYTADERETVVTQSDGSDVVRIWTAQRSVINRIREKPDVKVIAQGTDRGTDWMELEVPASRWNLAGAVRRRSTMTDEQKQAAAERLKQAREKNE
ncbi:hypothetical protein GCM10009700_27900 [Brevibacterium sanguinis]|uniref:hypothetical protein n=1 Tax=Brevibacterium sanguinis TaxID=232444 RepID=UPI0031E48EF6